MKFWWHLSFMKTFSIKHAHIEHHMHLHLQQFKEGQTEITNHPKNFFKNLPYLTLTQGCLCQPGNNFSNVDSHVIQTTQVWAGIPSLKKKKLKKISASKTNIFFKKS